MLYESWRQVAAAIRNEMALVDVPSGRRWTFAQLATAVEKDPGPPDNGSVAFPVADSPEFVMSVLRAWRFGQVLCPLEPGQGEVSVQVDLPKGIAHLKTTSATTGSPRLVAFTAPQLMADASNIVLTMGLRQDWPNLGVISLAHSYGFSSLVLPLVLHGIPLVLAGNALPEALRCASSTASALTLPAVPALWQAWHDAQAIPGNIRLAISAGAPLGLGLEQSVFARDGVKLHNFYGSSECGGIAYDASLEPRADQSCAGTAMRNVELSVADDRCLEVRSDAVADSYWPEPNPRLGRGVFRTSDLGRLDGGQVFLRGRASDQINVAGRKILPEAIEEALAAHPLVRRCLAFGIPAEAQRGEIVVACVLADGGLTRESLRHFALTRLPAWQVPREWWFVESLEANRRGKLSRRQWRTRYLAEVRGKARTG
jgi:long-chain acyl-CoA synthetase